VEAIGLEPLIYELMYKLEEKHWWYMGLRDLLFSTIRAYLGDRKDISVLDAGCGTGFNLKCLKERYGACGVDISGSAIECCRKRGLDCVSEASICALPYPNGTFDIVISFDVLYHKAVGDDVKAITEMSRVLKDGGILILNLPAFGHLMRSHDVKTHTARRYTSRGIADKLRGNGFEIQKIGYRNAFLYPVALAMSLVSRVTKGKESDLGEVNGALNSVLYRMAGIDNALVRTIGLPFGTSVYCVAKKKKGR
jgi:SAM-dependent methyltransferase